MIQPRYKNFAIKMQPRRGFSLMELAIVFGIIGVLTGGIWAMVAQGRQSAMQAQMAQEVLAVVTGVRSFYAGQAGLPASTSAVATTPAVTSQLLSIGAIPAEMQRAATSTCTNPNGRCADTIWGPNDGSPLAVDPGGTFTVCNWVSSSIPPGCGTSTSGAFPSSQLFAINIYGLNQANCIALATKIGSPLGPSGLVDVLIYGNGASTDLGANGSAINPVSPTVASAPCVPGSSGTSSLTFVYKLVPPS